MATGKQMTAGDGKDDRKLIVTVPAGERDGQEYCQESREGWTEHYWAQCGRSEFVLPERQPQGNDKSVF